MSFFNRGSLPILAAALLLGGLRDVRFFALGGAAVWAAVWMENPPIGPSVAWLAWLAWALVSTTLCPEPLAALPVLARWSMAVAFGSLAAAWKAGEREAWLKAFLGISAVLAAAALWTGAAAGFWFRAAMTGLIPPYYNYTAFALAAAAAAGATWALHPRTARFELRALGLFVTALCVVCLLLARSRGAGVGVLFAAAVWASRRWGAKAGAAVVVVAFLAGVAFPGALVKRELPYQQARPEIWRRAVEIAGERPWFGAGPGGFGAAFGRRPVEVRGGQARWGMGTNYAHSEPLQAAAETGWFGLALWLIGFGASLSVLLTRAQDEPVREAAAVAAAAMLPQLAVDNMLQIPGLAMLFFSALAVAGAPSAGGRRWPRALVVVGGLLALVSWIPRALADADPARAVFLFPSEAGPREDLAYRAMASGKMEEADRFWTEAEARAPFDAVYPWRRAQIAAARGRWEEAEALAARAALLEPGFLNDRVLRAEALARLKKTGAAREELTAILKVLRERGDRPGSSGYDATVWDFDRKEYDRVEGFVARANFR